MIEKWPEASSLWAQMGEENSDEDEAYPPTFISSCADVIPTGSPVTSAAV